MPGLAVPPCAPCDGAIAACGSVLVAGPAGPVAGPVASAVGWPTRVLACTGVQPLCSSRPTARSARTLGAGEESVHSPAACRHASEAGTVM